MFKKIWFGIGFYFILLVSLLSGCQAQNEVLKELSAVLQNDVMEVDNADLEEPEDMQSENLPSEGSSQENAQLEATENSPPSEESEPAIQEDANYTSKDEVSLYIHTYNKLPSNYITKKEAQDRGWNNKENTMAQVLPGMSIGGDHFGNYEGLLPAKDGRSYRECDIDYVSGGRNAKRIVFSNDGLVFYTGDHYATFEQLY